ncbi:MAG: choline-sulfatase [Pseudomonadota bacterium]
MDRPNIVFIQVDQLTAEFLGAYGNSACHAPTLDRLAAQGVVFDRAYCNFPLCSPSRASMAAGQLCSNIGAFDNAAELPASVPTYAHYLRAAGYHTALSGKMHFIGPDQHHGFEERLTPDLYPADFAWVPNWGDEGKRDTNDPRSVRIAGVCRHSKQLDFDDLVTEAAVRHLYHRAAATDQPFFLQVSYTHPHEPYLCRQEFWDLYDGKPLPGPRVGPLSGAEHDPHSLRILKDFGMWGVEFSDEEINTAIRGYYGAVSYIDSLVARVLDALDKAGLAETTMIAFTADHGEMLGERGMWFKKHFFERSLRIPLIFNAPWLAQRRVNTLASLVDLLPTFAGLANAPVSPEPLEGHDLTPLLNGGAEDDDRAVFAEYLAESTPSPILMIRRGPWKYITSSEDGEMLFDVEADPVEQSNRVHDAAAADVLAAFRAEAAAKWDADRLTAEIKLSQQRRILIRAAMGQGAPTRWNHGEAAGQRVPWYRGEEGYNEWAFDHL